MIIVLIMLTCYLTEVTFYKHKNNYFSLGAKMSETQYLAAKTIDEAVKAHSKANGSARFLSIMKFQ